MASCQMPLGNGHVCNQVLFKCAKCGARGCKNKQCKNQRFDSAGPRCYACGATSGITTA